MNGMTLFFTFFLAFIPVTVIQICMPFLTRRTESFGVSIPADQFHNEELGRMRRKYALNTVILAIAILIIMFLMNGWEPAFPVLLIGYIVLSFLVYLFFHNKMKAFKAEQNWNQSKKQTVMIDTSFRSQKLNHSNGWFVIGLVITLATLVWGMVMYDKMPARIPIKVDFSGHVTKWADKSVGTLLYLPVIQFYLLGLFIFLNAMISRSKAVIDPDNPEASVKRNVIFRKTWSAFLIGVGNLIVLMMMLLQLSFIYNINPGAIGIIHIAIVIIIVFAAIVLSFKTGQGGSRIRLGGKSNTVFVNRDDDKYWKLGVFYVNRHDPSIFVEKRFGLGWTVNLAHPLSWTILFGTIAIIVLISVLFNV